jgi:hypothetical protein
MSKKQDTFNVEATGNLISTPTLVEDAEGNKVCYCRMATNPNAKKYTEDGEEVSREDRNKTRAILDLKITNTAMAEIFHDFFNIKDRIHVKGEGYTRQVEKKYWSPKQNSYIPISVDIDEDGQNVVTLMEDRLVIRVHDFSKVEIRNGVSTLVCT